MPELANAQRRPSDPVSAGARAAHTLQGQGREGEAPLAAGNQALQRRLGATRAVQTKLEVSQPGDAWEREADAAAARVMRMPDGSAGLSSAAPPAISRLPAGAAGPLGRKEAAAPEDDRKARKATEKEASEAKAKAAAKEGEAAKKTEKEKKKEEDESKKMVHPLAIAGERARADEGVERAIEARRGQGVPLPAEERAFFEPRFGRRLDHVRVHADAAAARAARDVRAQAFATGNEVFFGAGRYQPGTPHGRALLAHELAHTIQQSPGPSLPAREPARPASPDVHAPAPAIHAPAPASPAVSAPSAVPRASTAAPVPRPAARAAAPPRAAPAPARAPGPAPVVRTAGRVLARQPTAAPPAGPAVMEPAAAEGTLAEEVPLGATFQPPAPVAARIEAGGRAGAEVRVRLRGVAAGTLRVRRAGARAPAGEQPGPAAYETVPPRGGGEHQAIPLTHALLDPLRQAGAEPVLGVRIRGGTVEGYASLSRGGRPAPTPAAVLDWIAGHADAMRWVGLRDLRFPRVTNELRGGVLTLRAPEFGFRLGGFLDGTGSLGLANETVTFRAAATVQLPGLAGTRLEIERRAEGGLHARAEVPVELARFSGRLVAEYGEGTVQIEGTAGYRTDTLSGEVTLLVTDAATARDVALRHLQPDQVQASADAASGADAPVAEGPRPGPRALAGWGTLDFSFGAWMTGRAQVIVDNEGHVTVIGEIAPPARVELFPQRDYGRRLLTLEARAPYGVPLVGSVFLFARAALDAEARLGPGTLYRIRVAGTYSTDPRVFNSFSIQGTLNVSAYAGLALRVDGGAGVELVGHAIRAGIGVAARAGIRGYVEATPTLGYRQVAHPEDGRVGEFYLHGHLELAAQPFLGLSGNLFVELDAPFWSPLPDRRWTHPLGGREYPLPGAFGIGADVDYVIGSSQLPQIQFREANFDSQRFLTDLVRQRVPRGGGREREQRGEWAERRSGRPGADARAATPPGQGRTDDSRPPRDRPAPELVKAAALEDVARRLRGGRVQSTAALDQVIDAVYQIYYPQGLRSLAARVPDENGDSFELVATASEPERRVIPWRDAFGPDDGETRDFFMTQRGFETSAAVSVNGRRVGERVVSDGQGHAEENLIRGGVWDGVLELLRSDLAQGRRSRVVLAINRAPCSRRCTPLLAETLAGVDAALRANTSFILAPTGVYEPTENLTEARIAEDQRKYRAIAEKWGRAGVEAQGYRVVHRSDFTDDTTSFADLERLAAAGWDIRQLHARHGPPTSAGIVLAEAAHRVAVRMGRVRAGSPGAGGSR